MKKFFYDRKIIFLYLFTTILLILGVTYAMNSNSLALGFTTAIVRIDEQAYGKTEFDASKLDFSPILDTEVEEKKENVIGIEFMVGGASTNNNDHVIYDIALVDLEVNCILLSPYLKWKLVKNGVELSTGSLDYRFDTIDEYGRFILTTIQEDLPKYNANQEGYDHYYFYLWLSDSCQSNDISECQNVPDQSALIGQNLSGKIEVELYTEGKKENVRTPSSTLSDSLCKDRYLIHFQPNGGNLTTTSKYVVRGEAFGDLPVPTKEHIVTFHPNGGENIVTVNKEEDVQISTTQNQLFSVPRVRFLASEVNQKKVTYIFEGWYLDENFTQKVESTDIVNVAENLTLYGKWSGDNTIVLPSTVRAGYTFLGWFSDNLFQNKIGDIGDLYKVNGDQVVYGKWEAKIYTIYFDSGNLLYGLNDILSVTDDRMTYSIDNKVVTVTANYDDGYGYTTGRVYLEAGRTYTFNCVTSGTWGLDTGSDTVQAFFMLDGGLTAYYHMNSNQNFQFTPTVSGTYWLRLDVNKNGVTHTFSDIRVSTSLGEKEEATGNPIGTLPNHNNGAYSLSKWYTEENGQGTEIVTSSLVPASNTTYFAKWDPKKFTVSYVSSLVSNGDFSNGVTGWTMSSFSARETIAGKNAVRVTSTGTESEGFNTSSNVEYKPNTKYRIRLKAYRNSSSSYGNLNKDFRVYIAEYDSSGNRLSWNHYITINQGNLADKTWKEFSAEITTRSNGVRFDVLRLDYYGVTGQSTIWVTDVKFEEVVGTSSVAYSQPYGNMPTPIRTGHNFTGWYNSDIGDQTVTTNTVVDKAYNHSVYARWANAVYTVSYNGNGATGGSTGNNYCSIDMNCSLATNGFTKKGYTFAGWATSASGSVVYGNNATVKNLTTAGGTVTLYAKWTPSTYSITLNNQSATSAGTSVAYYQYNTTKIVNGVTCYYYTNSNLTTCLTNGYTITKPVRTGYTFGGYYTGTGGTGTQYVDTSGVFINNIYKTLTSNTTLYAKWTPNTYTITYAGNGATSGSTANSSHTYGTAKNLTANGYARAYTVSYNANGGSVSPTSSTATYSFAGWSYNGVNYSNGQSVSNLTTTNGGIVTMTARWNSAAVTLPTPTRLGYIFAGWYTAASGGTLVGNGGAAYTPTSTLTVYAHWTLANYAISSPATGANTLAAAVGVANSGATITLQKTLTDNNEVSIKKNLTLNLGGYVLTNNVTIGIHSGYSLTFDNGTLVSSTVVFNNLGTLKINGGIVKGTKGINNAQGGKLYVSKAKVYGTTREGLTNYGQGQLSGNSMIKGATNGIVNGYGEHLTGLLQIFDSTIVAGTGHGLVNYSNETWPKVQTNGYMMYETNTDSTVNCSVHIYNNTQILAYGDKATVRNVSTSAIIHFTHNFTGYVYSDISYGLYIDTNARIHMLAGSIYSPTGKYKSGPGSLTGNPKKEQITVGSFE